MHGQYLTQVANITLHANNSCSALIGVHEMHGRMHPN